MTSSRHDPWIALRPGADPREHAATLRRIHASTVTDPGRSDVALRPTIRASWQRSAARGARPDAAGARAVVSDEELSSRRADHPLAATLPALRQLLRTGTGELEHIMVISDADGVLLWVEGPPKELSRAADDMNFVPGSDWSEAGVGTNSIGTAIAADHAVQVFSAEHYNAACHRWTCSGAPVHDPATGAVVGAIDLTTDLREYHPIGHQLVDAAARVAESILAAEVHRRDQRLLEHYLQHATDRYRAPSAMATTDGRVVAAFPPGWVGSRIPGLPPQGGPVPRHGIEATPVLGGAGLVLTPLAGVSDAAHILGGGTAAPPVELWALGRDNVLCRTAGRRVELSTQHSELLVLLALHPHGMTGAELADALHVDAATVRTAVVRLRAVLGDAIASRPYRLRDVAALDLWEVRDQLTAGRVGDALAAYGGPLLDGSQVPAIVAERERLARALDADTLDPDAAVPPPPF